MTSSESEAFPVAISMTSITSVAQAHKISQYINIDKEGNWEACLQTQDSCATMFLCEKGIRTPKLMCRAYDNTVSLIQSFWRILLRTRQIPLSHMLPSTLEKSHKKAAIMIFQVFEEILKASLPS